MNTRKLTALYAGSAIVATALAVPVTAQAESPHSVTANIGVVSNYMWRGTTQTGDDAAVQGGLDYAHSSGFYAGTWASNIDWGDGGAYELDVYAGYGGNINEDFSWDVNAIYYAYPSSNTRDSDFSEIGLSGTWKWFTLGVAYTIYGANDDGLFDNGDIYYYGGFEYGELPFGLSFEAHAGYYDFTNGDVAYDTVTVNGIDFDRTETADYWGFGASISKEAGDFGTFTFAWDQNNGKTEVGYDTDPKVWVGWNKEF